MANRVNVNINVSDHSRAGLAALRRNMQRMRNDVRRAGGDIRFNVRINDGASRREIRRITRSLRGEPVTIRTRLDPPTPPVRTLRQRIVRGLRRGVTVPVRFASRTIGRSLLAAVRGPARIAGRFMGGLLSDGIGQGIIGAFQAAGPVGMAVLAAIILGSLSMIGAALSGLIVGALGIAFVGVGLVSAATSEDVKRNWTATLDHMKGLFKTVGEPLIPVLNHAIDRLGRMADEAAPAFREAMVEASTVTDEFIQELMTGFERFADQAFQPLMDAWEVFGPVLGDIFSDFLDDLGNSFGEMADLVREHSVEIELAIRAAFKIIDFIIDTITFLGQTWVFTMGTMGDAAGAFVTVIQGMVNVILGVFDTIISGAASAFGWIPGIGPKLKEANTAFDNFRNSVNEKLNNAKSAAFGFDEALDRMNRERVLKANIKSWTAKMNEAKSQIGKVPKEAEAKLRANINDLNNKIAAARRELNSLNGRTATTYVRTVKLGIGAEAANAARRATGGVIGAAATGGVRSNMTMVGEHGPELVDLPFGSRVRSNPDSRRFMARESGRAGTSAQLLIDAAGDDVSRLLLNILRRAIRVQGGDVQVVLGRG